MRGWTSAISADASTRVVEPQRAVCARCGASFACDPGGDCWCLYVDVRLPLPVAGGTCLCAECMRAAAGA
jgi:hypothetical protein